MTPSASWRNAVISVPCSTDGAGLAGARPQDRFEARLVEEPAAARAHGVHAFVEIRDDVRELASGYAVHRDQRAVRDEFLRRFLAHARLDAETAEHLQGAHVEEGGAWQRRAFLQALDCDRANALLRQERGGREARQAAARDQYRCFVLHGPEHSAAEVRAATRLRRNWCG